MSPHDFARLPPLDLVPEETGALDPITLLTEIGRALTSGVPWEERSARALRALERRLGAVRTALFVKHPVSGALLVCASHGLSREHWSPANGQGVSNTVVERGLPVVMAEIQRDPLALGDLTHPRDWVRVVPPWSLCSVPISMGGRVQGALSCYFRSAQAADTGSRLDLLEVVASLFAPWLQEFEPTREVTPEAAPLPFVAGGNRARNMVGQSSAMRDVFEQIAKVARTNATALIRGASGTGKELVAQAIHDGSSRAGRPFVKVNCAALPETLFESELFGHERGAFTGALMRKKGRFELAEGGTIFLDEIGELAPATQAKLLRVLQFREFERLGSTEVQETDIRIITATNRNIEEAVLAGTFRHDFYYRLNVFTIHLPELRERRSDIPALAEHFAALYAKRHLGSSVSLSDEAIDALMAHDFPGNVRELENVIERAVVSADGPCVLVRDLPPELRGITQKPREAPTLAASVGELECQLIEQALRETRGNAARAARTLGTTERIVRYKAAKYGIDSSRFRGANH